MCKHCPSAAAGASALVCLLINTGTVYWFSCPLAAPSLVSQAPGGSTHGGLSPPLSAGSDLPWHLSGWEVERRVQCPPLHPALGPAVAILQSLF